MSAFLDASVIVAIISREDDAAEQAARVNATHGTVYVSSVVQYEAAISLARKKSAPKRPSAETIAAARLAVAAFLEEIGAVEVELAGAITTAAIAAAGRFGKVVGHPARLNMGDCFAYACARELEAPLIFKGDDFSHTDVAVA